MVVSGGTALLVDTQFDLRLTRSLQQAIVEAFPQVTVSTVVTTHANGDHCWGNQLFPAAEFIGSAATGHGMAHEVQPDQLAALSAPDGPDTVLGDYMRRHFGHFDFSGITVTPPTRTFSGRLGVQVGGRLVELIEVGPAHTDGDVIVHVPDAGVVFTGDILFVGDHPIMWTGPADNWIAACELIVDTGARYVVPGHGPVTDLAGVRLFATYLRIVAAHAERSHAAGLPYWEAAEQLSLPMECSGWGHRERLVITMAAAYRNLGEPAVALLDVLARAADYERRLLGR
nr:MBL fold metallo-hydrolase [Actinoplanes sp. N902-109]